MNNFNKNFRVRRFRAFVSSYGTTQLHLRNPYQIAWWSAAFPGFGHLLLSKYLRGYLLMIWEVFINVNAKLNLAIVYSFTGRIDLAKDVLDQRWVLLYIPVYIFAIWDSYRTAVDLNKIYLLADYENSNFPSFAINSVEVNYLDRRRPSTAALWSFFTPGLGQLYLHRVLTGAFTLGLVIVFVYFSKLLPAVHFIFLGQITEATKMLDPQWALFIPSLYGYSIYDAYVNSVENNKLFESEQRKFLKEHYQLFRVKFPW